MDRIRKDKGLMLCAVVCCAVLSSCLWFGHLPPGVVKINGAHQHTFSAAVSLEAQYAVYAWYCEEYRDQDGILSAAEAGMIDVANKLFLRQCKACLQSCSPLFRMELERPVLEPAMFSQNLSMERGQDLLKELQRVFGSAISVVIPLEEASSPELWSNSSSAMRDSFLAWAHRNKTLQIKDPQDFDRQKFLGQIKHVDELLNIKQRMSTAISEYEDRVPQDFMGRVAALKKLLLVSRDIPQGISLEELGDKETVKHFHQLMETVPLACIYDVQKEGDAVLIGELSRLKHEGLSSDGHADSVLTELEEKLATYLKMIDEIPCLKETRNKIHGCEELLQGCARLRLQLWRDQLQGCIADKRYWTAYNHFLECHRKLVNNANAVSSLYNRNMIGGGQAASAPVILDELQKIYLDCLGEAISAYYSIAEKNIEVDNAPESTYAICLLMGEMLELPEPCKPAKNLEQVKKKIAKLQDKAIGKLEIGGMRRMVSLGELSSAIPGLGITYKRDLENELKNVLEAFGLSKYVFIPENANTQSQWGYMTFGGVVANFEGDEVIERKTTRTVTRFKEHERFLNPNYNKNAPQNAERKLTSQWMYEQEEVRQVIHVREITRQAHVRVFMELRGPGFSRRIEVNEFYSKVFNNEESHPINDVVILGTKTYYDAMDVPKADGVPVIQYDRVWTSGQILDWARHDSLSALSLLILYNINEYPMYLRRKARGYESNEDLFEAVKNWSLCYLISNSVNTERDISEVLRSETPPVAKAYLECVEKLRKQMVSIARLQRESKVQLLSSTGAYLNETLRKK